MNHRPFFVLLNAGRGARFQDASPCPKPWVPVLGKPIWEWCFGSFLKTVSAHAEMLVVTQNDDCGKLLFLNMQKRAGVQMHHVPIPYHTRGPAETLALALSHPIAVSVNSDGNRPFWVIDNDVVFDADIDWDMAPGEDIAVMTQHVSYLQDKDAINQTSPYCHVVHSPGEPCRVQSLQEKQVASDWVILGAYGFASAKTFESALHRMSRAAVAEEWFMSTLINSAIDHCDSMVASRVAKASFTVGTPFQVQRALEQGMLRSEVPLRIVFDLDNTLFMPPPAPGEYGRCKPVSTMAQFARSMKSRGHTIVIHTARRMLTCGGDVATIENTIGEDTRASLDRHGIPYDELIFGKPYADMYIDDKAVNAFNLFSGDPGWNIAGLGFGMLDAVQLPVCSNVSRLAGTGVCCKYGRAGQLAAYAEYLRHVETVPCIADLFPRMHTYVTAGDADVLMLEWIDGIKLGHMYSRDLMTDDVMKVVLDTLERLHVAPSTSAEADHELLRSLALQNYLSKLKGRLESSQCYLRFPGLPLEKMVGKLEAFPFAPKIVPIIHGDYWLSNILWVQSESRVRLIDMRGSLGNLHTASGDATYDYAKLLQSLVGFDHVLYTGNVPCAAMVRHFSGMLYDHAQRVHGISRSAIEHACLVLMLGSLPFHAEFACRQSAVTEMLVSFFEQNVANC